MALTADETGFGSVRNSDPTTSEEAARQYARNQDKYADILAFVGCSDGPVNNEDIALALGVEQIGSISPRISELIHVHHLLRATGKKKNSRGVLMRSVTLVNS